MFLRFHIENALHHVFQYVAQFVRACLVCCIIHGKSDMYENEPITTLTMLRMLESRTRTNLCLCMKMSIRGTFYVIHVSDFSAIDEGFMS